MFAIPTYNLPPHLNEGILAHNLAGLSLHNQPSNQSHQPQQQQPQQHQSQQIHHLQQQHHHQQQQQQIDFVPFQQPSQQFGNYPIIETSVGNTTLEWPSPEDSTQLYQQGYTIVRQFNNNNIDDYYKKFLRPITDYVAIPTNGQPTYVYQNLGSNGQTETAHQQPTDQQNSANGNGQTTTNDAQKPSNSSPPTTSTTDEKKHKKKHKKRSSKSNADGTKNDETTETPSEHQQQSDQKPLSPTHSSHGTANKISPPLQAPSNGLYQQQQQQQQPPAHQIVYQQPIMQNSKRAVPPPQHQQKIFHQQQVQPIGLRPQVSLGPGQAIAPIPMKHETNPVVYFEIEIDDNPRGRIVMELFSHVLPRTAQNFLSLATNEFGFGYRLSYFHRIIPGFMAQGGDFEKSNGTGGYSVYGEKFDDESFPYLHNAPGLLSIAFSCPYTIVS